MRPCIFPRRPLYHPETARLSEEAWRRCRMLGSRAFEFVTERFSFVSNEIEWRPPHLGRHPLLNPRLPTSLSRRPSLSWSSAILCVRPPYHIHCCGGCPLARPLTFVGPFRAVSLITSSRLLMFKLPSPVSNSCPSGQYTSRSSCTFTQSRTSPQTPGAACTSQSFEVRDGHGA